MNMNKIKTHYYILEIKVNRRILRYVTYYMFVLLFTSFWMPAPFLPFGYDTEYIWLSIVVYSLIPTGVFIEEQWYNIKFGGENNHKILDLWIKSYEYTQNICLLNKNYLPCLHCIIEKMLMQNDTHTYTVHCGRLQVLKFALQGGVS